MSRNRPDIWDRLEAVAPHTKAVFEVAASQARDPSLNGLPWALIGMNQEDPQAPGWQTYLDSPSRLNSVITNRELLLRYLLSRAIIDQGADVVGVEMRHTAILEAAYGSSPPLLLLHEPGALSARYPYLPEAAARAEAEVTRVRAPIWAARSARRQRGTYTPYNAPAGRYSHWFLAARFYPALLLALAVEGGLTEIVFCLGGRDERPIEMARRLRNDVSYGLGYCLGDKAADLFPKWVVGTFRLTPAHTKLWVPADTVIPMDQRIGRLIMRTGLMDEFFGVARLLDKPMVDYRGTGTRANGQGLVAAPHYLTVRDFRRRARVPAGHARAWLNAAWHEFHAARPPAWDPQEVVSVLCRTLSGHLGREFTPVHLDDAFMAAGELACSDELPTCTACPFGTACQANSGVAALKGYFT